MVKKNLIMHLSYINEQSSGKNIALSIQLLMTQPLWKVLMPNYFLLLRNIISSIYITFMKVIITIWILTLAGKDFSTSFFTLLIKKASSCLWSKAKPVLSARECFSSKSIHLGNLSKKNYTITAKGWIIAKFEAIWKHNLK